MPTVSFSHHGPFLSCVALHLRSTLLARRDPEARDGARKYHDIHRRLYRLTQPVCADVILLQGHASGGVYTVPGA